MRANLRGTPYDPTEVIVREIEVPLPDVYYVAFGEIPDFATMPVEHEIPTNVEVVRHMYRFVGVVESVGYSPIAEYELVKEEL